MKKLFALILALCLLLALTACGGKADADEAPAPEMEQLPEDFKIPLRDTGVKIGIPAEVGFETYESEINDFSGGGPSGEWRIIVNAEPKSDYPDCTLAQYAELSALANEGEVGQDADGNYYFTYINKYSDDEVYHFYTAVRENADQYYRIAMYCFEEHWSIYGESFAEWATTIEVE